MGDEPVNELMFYSPSIARSFTLFMPVLLTCVKKTVQLKCKSFQDFD